MMESRNHYKDSTLKPSLPMKVAIMPLQPEQAKKVGDWKHLAVQA